MGMFREAMRGTVRHQGLLRNQFTCQLEGNILQGEASCKLVLKHIKQFVVSSINPTVHQVICASLAIHRSARNPMKSPFFKGKTTIFPWFHHVSPRFSRSLLSPIRCHGPRRLIAQPPAVARTAEGTCEKVSGSQGE